MGIAQLQWSGKGREVTQAGYRTDPSWHGWVGTGHRPGGWVTAVQNNCVGRIL